ncbi:hypothetical protein AVEN_211288-1 [Araneus ventricosus]|uniref:BTB domain-containing protein n=1 Tax=Araneus ventricosus TaxID=182803 RepID=A0A4Y2HNF7_ARAVE|nr:hypothetical protein AVEN_211288-1 [Araneus ventricosus]
MEETEFAQWEAERRSTDNYSLQLKINFLKDDKKVCRFQTMKLRRYNQQFKFRFSVSVYPNGVNRETEGWLVVLPDVMIPKHKQWPQDYGILSCTVSVIDIEGNPTLPRSFEEIPSEEDDRYPKYLERSLILNRKDEFLSEGVLSVCCDIHFYFNTIFSKSLTRWVLTCSIPWEFYFKNGADPEDTHDISKRDPSDSFRIFDFTHQILTLPPSHESRRRFGIYGISSTKSSFSSDSVEDMTDILEHVWIFDTETDRIFVSLDEQQDGVGSRLLKASPVIERMVNAPMKERLKKRIHFPDVSTQIFLTVLSFLENGILPTSPDLDTLGVYRFSHFHRMEELQRKCAEEMVKGFEFSTEELKRTADDYSDEYLSEMLVSRWRDYEDSGQPIFRIHERLNFDCYI